VAGVATGSKQALVAASGTRGVQWMFALVGTDVGKVPPKALQHWFS